MKIDLSEYILGFTITADSNVDEFVLSSFNREAKDKEVRYSYHSGVGTFPSRQSYLRIYLVDNYLISEIKERLKNLEDSTDLCRWLAEKLGVDVVR